VQERRPAVAREEKTQWHYSAQPYTHFSVFPLPFEIFIHSDVHFFLIQNRTLIFTGLFGTLEVWYSNLHERVHYFPNFESKDMYLFLLFEMKNQISKYSVSS
jgi:uncharacterized membrane protein